MHDAKKQQSSQERVQKVRCALTLMDRSAWHETTAKKIREFLTAARKPWDDFQWYECRGYDRVPFGC